MLLLLLLLWDCLYQQVRILEKATETIGTARGITDTGELLVEELKGEMRKVFSGEVSVRGLYSYV